MAIGDGVGEIIDIEIRGSSKGLSEAANELNRTHALLEKFNKALSNSTNISSRSQKAFDNLANSLSKVYVKNLVTYLSEVNTEIKKESQSAALAAKQNDALAKSLEKAGYGARKFGDNFNLATKSGREGFAKWKKEMDTNIPFLMKPKSTEHLRNNARILFETMANTNKVGIANASTVKALETGISGTFTRGLSKVDKFNIAIGTTKRNMDSFFQNMRLQGKNLQWTGMQMMTGITLPILGFGAIAVREFDSVNKQMRQLKKVTEYKADYDALTESIKKMSTEFGVSRSVMTGLYRDIAALGIDDQGEIEKWVKEVTQISLLGDIDMSVATDFVRSISAIFDEGKMEKTPEILAQLNAIADETSLQLGDLAQSFPEVAPTMKQLGFEASGVAAALASMYKQGIPATEGAHALKHGMTRLIDPTKDATEIINELGFSFYDATGKASNGTLRLMSLMKKLGTEMSDEDRNKAVSEMFGGRQSARYNALIDDMTLGMKQLNEALGDGIIKTDEIENITSDWARSLIASGEIASEALDPLERYSTAMSEFKADPSTQLAIAKTKLKSLLVDLGAMIVPAFNAMMDKAHAFFEILMQAPNWAKYMVGAILVIASTMGPLIYVFAQAKNAIATFGITAAKVLPRGFKDINGIAHAMKLLKADPNRTDIIQYEGKFGQLSGRKNKKSDTRALKDGMERLTRSQVENMAVEAGLEKQAEKTTIALYKEAMATEAATKATNRNTISENKNLANNMFSRNGKSIDGPMVKPAWGKNAAGELTRIKNLPAPPILSPTAVASGTAMTGIFGKLGGLISKIVPLFAKFAKFTWIMAAITAAVILLKKGFEGLSANWERVAKKIEPGINALKTAWNNISAAIDRLKTKFGEILGQLSGGSEAKTAGGFWDMLGDAINKAAIGIAYAMDLIARGIEIAWPLIEGFGYAVKAVIGFVSSLFAQDWRNALIYFAAFAYEGIRPVIAMLELLVNVVLWTVKTTLNGLEWLARGFQEVMSWIGINTTGVSDFFNAMSNGVQGLADENMLDYFDQIRTMGDTVFQDSADAAIPEEPSGEGMDNAENYGEEVASSMADGIDDEMKDRMANPDWLKDFLGAAKSRIQEQVDEVKNAAIKALEDAQSAEQKIYDDKIKQIEDVEAAEEKLFREQEYLQKKKEMLAKRAIDIQNYQRNRALAIYEGRIDDARQLDLEHEKSSMDFNKDMMDMESERKKELVKEARDAQKESINTEKKALEERQKAFMEYFKKQLDLLTEYTPRTVGEFQKMVSSITGLLSSGGAEWTENAATASGRMFYALHQANEDIRQDFAWSGNAAITAWMAAFAAPDVIAILKQNSADNGKAIGDALEKGVTDGLDGAMDELDSFNSEAPGKMQQFFDSVMPTWEFNWDQIGLTLGEKMDRMEQDFWNGIERIKEWFGALPQWFGERIDNIENIFGEIPGWLGGLFEQIENLFSNISNFMTGLVNNVIGLINGLIDGYNLVATKIPGMVTLDHLSGVGNAVNPGAAAAAAFSGLGGRLFASGGITSGPSIAGEGMYPEFIIPTDPKYRGTAEALTAKASAFLGQKYLTPSIPSVSGGSGGGATTIYVDTFIGEEEWFNKMAQTHDIKVGKKKAMNTGSQTRVLSKYNENDRGAF